MGAAIESLAPTAPVRRFGRHTLRVDVRELDDGVRRVRLEPRTCELLCLLLDRAGLAVSRDEIIGRLWGGRVVTDDAVNRQLAKLRRALGDDGGWIETVPKFGYRLLTAEPPAVAATAVSAPATAPQSAKADRLLFWLLLLGAVLSALALVKLFDG